MTNHTRGKWYAVGWMVEHAGEDIADICCCNPAAFGQTPPNVKKRSDKEMWANAILIAAAPEMLSILNRIAVAPADINLDIAIDDARKIVLEIREAQAFGKRK
jgi:hypothetical protein